MEPISETLEAPDEVDAYVDGENLQQQMRTTADRARRLVPGLVGVSVGFRSMV